MTRKEAVFLAKGRAEFEGARMDIWKLRDGRHVVRHSGMEPPFAGRYVTTVNKQGEEE